ncbi:MAG: hypothetical protein ACJ762_11870 [Solirubrobacteraceae bacterium]
MLSSPLRLPQLLLSTFALLALCAPAAFADSARQKHFDATTSAFRAAKQNIPVSDPGPPPGAQVLKYKFGPMRILPGQNKISIDLQSQRPNVDGYIVGFRPGLVYADGTSPSVKVIHLHHAVWLVGEGQNVKPTFAAGEEKTYFNAPRGFGWRYQSDPSKQTWLINHMIHDLTSQPQEVYITYTLWFIPDTAPEAASITKMNTLWMDVEGLKPYPVFNALKGTGTKGRFTYPDQAKNPYAGVDHNRNEWVADHDGTLVSTAGHLHPGGLWTDLDITRDGVTKRIFRSRANYFEPSGAVSWDVAMSAASDKWRVNFKKGDVISTSATYDTTRASWYEVMGIMVVGMTDAPVAGGVDPFTGTIDQSDTLTHGRLKENIDSNVGISTGLQNPIARRAGPYQDRITIKNFVYSQGDLSRGGKTGRPPLVRQGSSLTFVNQDNPLTVRFHTVTSCKLPCTKSGGIGYPLADGPFDFDSGELGFGPTIPEALVGGTGGTVPFTAAVDTPTSDDNCAAIDGLTQVISDGCVGTTIYKTPKNLNPGTYAYFCRVHPFMRGAFRVVKGKKKS